MRNLKSQNTVSALYGRLKLLYALTRAFDKLRTSRLKFMATHEPEWKRGGLGRHIHFVANSGGKDITCEGVEDAAGKKSSLRFIYPPKHFIQLRMICF